MFNPGDIVFQKNTLVNKKNFKDNKDNRLSVILFEIKINDKDYVCSCPITNHVQTIKNFKKNSIYIPFQILNDYKYCSIKIDSLYLYPVEEIKLSGLNLNEKTMLKIYDNILNLDNNETVFNLEELNIIKNNIEIIKNNLDKTQKKKLKEEKRLRKIKRKELKKNYNIKKD